MSEPSQNQAQAENDNARKPATESEKAERKLTPLEAIKAAQAARQQIHSGGGKGGGNKGPGGGQGGAAASRKPATTNRKSGGS